MRLRFCFLVVSLVVALAQPTQGQSSTVTYDGLDIVFLVDQSGSMGGREYGFRGTGTDPLGLRFEALQYAIDVLGSYRLNFASDYPINLAVVYFGSDAERGTIRNGWRAIATDEAAWESQRQELLDLFSAESFRATTRPANLGDTNFNAAFQEAILLFSQLNTRNHMRVIIILTDGAPCVPQEMGNDCPLQGQQRHMDRLLALTQRDFSASNNLIFVVAFDEEREFWPRWEARWQEIVGQPERARLASSSEEIGARFIDILNDLFERSGREEARSVALRSGSNVISVPPYVRELRVSFFKSDATPANLNATRPNGRTLRPDDPQLRITNSNRPIEVWYLSQPEAGDWTFEVDDSRTRMNVYLAFLPLRVNAQVDDGPFSQYEDVVLRLQLRQEDGSPLPPPSDPYELKLAPSLIQPDGQSLPLQAVPLTESKYEIRLRPRQSGEYRLSLEIKASAPLRPEVTLLDAEIGRFRVSASVLELLSAVAGEYLEGDELALRVRLSREDSTILSSESITVEASLEGGGQRLSQTLAFNEAEGVYEGRLALSFSGDATFSLEAYWQDGQERFQLGQTIRQRLSILPSLPVGLRLRQPLNAEYFDTQGIPPASVRLDVLLEAYALDSNQPVDLEALASDPAALWQVQVSRDGRLLDEQPLLVREGQGRYRLPLGELSTGLYELNIQAKGALRDRFVLGSEAALGLRFNVVSNPSTQLFYVAVVTAVLIVLAILGWIIWRQIDVRRHPCRGKLAIVRLENGHPSQELLSINLDALRRNRVNLRLPNEVKAETLIQRAVVECLDERMSKEGRVRVTFYPKGKPKRSSNLSRGSSVLLGSQHKDNWPGYDHSVTLDYQLCKDMDSYSDTL
ncbi:MAG: VWA domain-containing protein [Anaerolineae bacterium]|nr:VWA domain-containing protein [Anaerolineae bacterium]MDW8173737.1 vWA domain-containing protein [Anaerolineae bacterium]